IGTAIMLISTAIPFIWMGVSLTIRRLRTLGWPVLWACLFFVPYANFIFFAVLALKKSPSAPPVHRGEGAKVTFSNAMLVSVVVAAVCIALVIVATVLLQAYGWGLFVGVPFFTGFIPAVVYRSGENLTFRAGVRMMVTIQALVAL